MTEPPIAVKACIKCKTEYPGTTEYFDKSKYHLSGITNVCKPCRRLRSTKKRAENRESINAYYREWKANHPGRTAEIYRKWAAANIEKERERGRKKTRKLLSTGFGKLNNIMRNAINRSIKNRSKAGRRWVQLVGYTPEQLKKHIERQFKPGMSWENWGSVWQLDHKIPVAVFNFDRPEDLDFGRCWSLKNLQPLEKHENRQKSDKIDKPFQPALRI